MKVVLILLKESCIDTFIAKLHKISILRRMCVTKLAMICCHKEGLRVREILYSIIV